MNPPLPPVLPPDVSPVQTVPTPKIARWRWWLALILIGSMPILIALSSLRREVGSEGPMLPTSPAALAWFTSIQMGSFAVLFGLFWLLSRANRDELWLRYTGWKSLLWGVGYSVLMRLALAWGAMVVVILLAIAGYDIKTMMELIRANGETMRDAFSPALASGSPLFRVILVIVISFVVAGLREELWRCATLAAMIHLAPQNWTQERKNTVSVLLSSALFGCGHFYQGIIGVIGTTLLGVVLGAILLRHKSIWPAVVAHGSFNAVSFAALAFVGNAK